MAIDNLQAWELHKTENFRHRLTVAVAAAALVVLNEGTGVAKHAARRRWADLALAEPSVYADRMAWAVIADATVQAAGVQLDGATVKDSAATDAQIQAAVNALISQFAPDLVTNTVADGTYVVGAKLTTSGANGAVVITNGVISAITQAS